jgi:hypothetical protein
MISIFVIVMEIVAIAFATVYGVIIYQDWYSELRPRQNILQKVESSYVTGTPQHDKVPG